MRSIRKCQHLLLFMIFLISISIAPSFGTEENSVNPKCDDKTDPACASSIETDGEKKQNKRQAITIEEVEKCNKERQKCLDVCGNTWEECIKDCPLCPEVDYPGFRKIIVRGDDHNSYSHETPLHGTGANITTVIKLTNLINNTNIVEVPTNVNSTNINHIHVYQNDSSSVGGKFGMGYDRSGSCCLAVQPKTCSPSSEGYRCHHKRHKTCGSQCTSRVIHVQMRRRCTRGVGCRQKIAYVGQPRRPRCVYTRKWPHVSCGGNYKQRCDGCYDHYGYGAQSFYQDYVPEHCMGCYDDAFNVGPLYRRGPVLRPFYNHQPPCYLTGTCNTPYYNMYGYYGNDMVDPAWGYQVPYEFPQDYDETLSTDMYDYNDLDVPFKSNQNRTIFHEADWGTEYHKCRVVEDDGSITIKNCTNDDYNPFSGTPTSSKKFNGEYPPMEFDDDLDGDNDDDFRFKLLKRNSRRYENDLESVSSLKEQNIENEEDERKVHRRHTRKQKRRHEIVYDDE